MRHLRSIAVVFFALLFVVSANRCLIASAFHGASQECCVNERGPVDSDRSLPCGESGCDACVTLESGVNLAALVPSALPAPVWTQVHEFMALMRRLTATVVAETSVSPPDMAWIPSPTWLEVVKKALPVRGPSLVA
jgi:hypothetical protein